MEVTEQGSWSHPRARLCALRCVPQPPDSDFAQEVKPRSGRDQRNSIPRLGLGLSSCARDWKLGNSEAKKMFLRHGPSFDCIAAAPRQALCDQRIGRPKSSQTGTIRIDISTLCS